MNFKSPMNRRTFLGASASAAAALSVLPKNAIGKTGARAAGDKLRIGYIGCGTQGLHMLRGWLAHPEIHVSAVCDCNRNSQDYIEWGKFSLRDMLREFLGDPEWGREDTGCRAGLEIGRLMVDHYYSAQTKSGKPPRCAAYEDYREMLEKEDLDGVCIMTPEHTHATIAIAAMNKKRHVIMHKPISNVLSEVRLAVETAKKAGVATHLFCAADMQTTPLITEWIQAGAIGPVREVIVWSNRPVWPQDLLTPVDTPSVPEGFNWDLWLGPAEYRPYHPMYAHTNFRAWYDFGTWTLGDMGHYCFFQVWKILRLGDASSVEASSSTFYETRDGVSVKMENAVSFPRSSRVTWEFPARGDMPPVTINWTDGGIRPPKLRELEMDGRDMPPEGLLFVGDKGKILADFIGDGPRLIPEKKMKEFVRPPETLERPIDEMDQWIRACKGGRPSDARFEVLQPINETLLLGTIAQRIPDQLNWDAEAMRFRNSDAANDLLYRKYRKGWELPIRRS